MVVTNFWARTTIGLVLLIVVPYYNRSSTTASLVLLFVSHRCWSIRTTDTLPKDLRWQARGKSTLSIQQLIFGSILHA